MNILNRSGVTSTTAVIIYKIETESLFFRGYIMDFLPQHYPLMNVFTFLGIMLFICHIIAEILFKTGFIPRISSYILIGVLCGPHLLNIVNRKIISEMSFVTDISMALILFMIGRHLNLKWLKNDSGLLLTCVFELLLTILPIFLLLKFFGWITLYAFTAAILISIISPAILLLVTDDFKSEGPIARRALMITSFNNFFALVIFSLIYPYFEISASSLFQMLTHSLYRAIGSILLGVILFKILEFLNYYIIPKKQREQFILLISMLIAAIGISKFLNLSIFLTLISIGISTRNLDWRNSILEANFGDYTHIFFIPLFFMTGCYLDLSGFLIAPIVVIGCILIRVFAKISAVFLFKKQSIITNAQAIYLGSALMPLSGFAINMGTKVGDFNPELGVQLMGIVSACIGVLGIAGPIMLQYILLKSNETFENIKKV
ncbi:MAG: hypothetical protein K0R24_425 [Gammaproteobacteria bacterium]|jgi:Kef-type K+ transport system membrane component KefB|nr:hypothetical protein [Gammaproteobacteria bacterium]